MQPRRGSRPFNRREKDEFEERVLQIKRVSKKTKGGNKRSFTALTLVGNREGKVGVGLGKAGNVPEAIRKSTKKARRKLVTIDVSKGTIKRSVVHKRGAAKILLKPAPAGSGLIAGGPVRAVAELVGIKDVSSKILGTSNIANNVHAAIEAFASV